MSHADVAARAALALEAGEMATFEWHLPSDAVRADARFHALFGFDRAVTGGEVLAIVDHDDRPGVRRKMVALLERDEYYDAAFRIRRADGSRLWIGGRGTVVERAPDGAPIRMLGVNWDMSGAKAQEARAVQLAREMDHRVNNAFALMEAMVSLGGQMAGDYGRARRRRRRSDPRALGAHRIAAEFLLHHQDAADRVMLGRVVEQVIGSRRGRRPEDRVRLVLDPALAVAPRDVSPLAMILHDLTASAVKGSVLGRAAGSLEVILGSVREGRAYLQWIERLDEPDPAADARDATGFGALLRMHGVEKLGADTIQDEAGPAGYSYILEFDAIRAD